MTLSRALLLPACLVFACLSHAAGLSCTLAPERLSVEPVSEVHLRVVHTNATAGSELVSISSSLDALLVGGAEKASRIRLYLTEGTEGSRRVEAGGFLSTVYRFRLPPGFSGPVVVDVPQLGAEPVMFSVKTLARALPAESATAGHRDRPEEAQAAPQARAQRLASLRRATRLLPGVSAYEPVYFGLGISGGLNAKFQLSLKYQPLDGVPLYAGYTQTSLWDLHGYSKPFHDSAYRPSLFWLHDDLWVSASTRLRLGLQTGLEHESNGRGGVDTRSINIAFFRPRLEWRLSKASDLESEGSGLSLAKPETRLIVSPKIYAYLEKSENPDIAHYRGYADLYVALLHGNWRFSTTLRRGTHAHYGSILVDAVMPLHVTDPLFRRVGLGGVNGYWFLQYFNGWGESIIDYRTKRESQVRAGILVVP